MSNANKPWNPLEISYLYHLIVWGYSGEEVGEIATKLLPQRPPKGVISQVSVIRKYISKQKGYNVSNYNTSGNLEKLFKKGGQISPTEPLLKYKPTQPKEFIHSRVVNVKPTKKVQPSVEQQPEVKQQFNHPLSNGGAQEQVTQTTPATTPVQPGIIEVMRIAKELGASEVEYNGVKIKF